MDINETTTPSAPTPPVGGRANKTYIIGRRVYTRDEYVHLARENKAAAGPLLITVGAVVIFAAIMAILFGMLDWKIEGAWLVVAGLVMAIVPALIWLFAFLQQDRLEPEPKRYVFGVFILGALLAQAVGQPLIRDFFGIQNWASGNALVNILASILIAGFIQEFLKYAAVRYTVFYSGEFDERVDGIIYGAAAGLGYATMLNVQYIISNGGVDLGIGVMRVATTALAQASFAGVVGYFLGIAKFERKGALWLPLGLTLAAVLNGVASYVLGQVTRLGGFSFNPWYGLVVAVIIAGGTFYALFMLIRRLNEATLAEAR